MAAEAGLAAGEAHVAGSVWGFSGENARRSERNDARNAGRAFGELVDRRLANAAGRLTERTCRDDGLFALCPFTTELTGLEMRVRFKRSSCGSNVPEGGDHGLVEVRVCHDTELAEARWAL